MFVSATDSRSTARDTIADFASGDRIDLSAIDARTGTAANDAFGFIGEAAFTGVAGQLRVGSDGAGGWLIEGDINGDGLRDLVIAVDMAGDLPPVASDFVL